MDHPSCPHQSSIEMICAEPNCFTPLCPQCLQTHHALTKHELSLILNSQSIEFFIQFTDYLIARLNEWILLMTTSNGFSKVFQINTYSFVSHNSNQVANHSLQILRDYSQLLHNNLYFVASNKININNLNHPQFLKDISQMFFKTWQIIGANLCQQIKTELTRLYPYRFSYKNIQLKINPAFVAQIQAYKQTKITQIREKVLVSYQIVHQELLHRQVQAKVLQRIRTVSQNFKQVDSFEQILEGSYSLNMNEKHILDESLQTFSPHYPTDGLEKQLQDLLFENEKLRQQNLRLRFQNKLLVEQNTQLRRAQLDQKSSV